MPGTTKHKPTAFDLTIITELLGPDPDLYAPHLPGETDQEHLARRTAAVDIATDVDAAWEAASIAGDGIDHVADLARRRVDLWGEAARQQVAAWVEEIQAGGVS